MAVIDCMEDPDESLKLKTLTLLSQMTRAANVAVITGRMMEVLKSSSDEHIRRDIVQKVRSAATVLPLALFILCRRCECSDCVATCTLHSAACSLILPWCKVARPVVSSLHRN